MNYEQMYRALVRAVLRDTCEDGNPFENLRDSLRAIEDGQPDPNDDDEAQYHMDSDRPVYDDN